MRQTLNHLVAETITMLGLPGSSLTDERTLRYNCEDPPQKKTKAKQKANTRHKSQMVYKMMQVNNPIPQVIFVSPSIFLTWAEDGGSEWLEQQGSQPIAR